MGTTRNAVVGLVCVCFLGALAPGPLVSNPETTAPLEGGPGPGLSLWVPLLLVTVAIGWFRLRSSGSGDTARQQPRRHRESNHWGKERGETGPEHGEDETGGPHPRDAEDISPDHSDGTDDPTGTVLGGQGGARDRGFEIETDPPDSGLSDHLDHLREELDDREAATELRTLEEVVEEFEGEQTVPDYCPGEHCDAVWEARTITGIKAGRYELLDDGKEVRCLDCEEIFVLGSTE